MTVLVPTKQETESSQCCVYALLHTVRIDYSRNDNFKYEIEASDQPFDKLPKDIARCFRFDEQEVYRSGTKAIRDYLLRSGEKSIELACELFDDDYPFRVYIEDYFHRPTIWFALYNFALKYQIWMMIPTSIDIPNQLPQRLAKIYKSASALTGQEAYIPRLTVPTALKTPNRSPCWSIIRYGNGDHLVLTHENEFAYFDHTCEKLISVPLEKFLDPFLDDLFGFEVRFDENGPVN